jgi:glycosyltransferase involved in cell wall biosynthesis
MTVLAGKRVLYISYNGMLDPLGQSQVIPYLKELGPRGLQFWLLSFERPRAFAADANEGIRQLRAELAEHGIDWHFLRYHQKFSLPATAYDVAAGIRRASRLVRDHQIELVHARSHIPATMALRLKQRFGTKMIFDVRGLMADEYVDANHWRKGSLAYRLTKSAEHKALAAADGIVTLTEKIWPIMRQWGSLRDRDVVHEVVPCCADLELFRFAQTARDSRREQLGIADRFVLVYSGSIDGWYLTEQMADFFSAIRDRNPRAYLLWLSPSRHERIRGLMSERGISASDYHVVAAMPREVSSYLSAADAGLAFIKPCFSKLASSPTKFAEYLACGLPLIINAGIGDSDDLILKHKAGVLVTEFNAAAYNQAATGIVDLVRGGESRKHCRAIATQLFDLQTVGGARYARLYERIFAVP